MRIYLSILFILISGILYPQSEQDERLAQEYYRKGEFTKAIEFFEKIYKQKKVKNIYTKYIDCLINIQSYKKAEKIIKSYYRKNNDPAVLVDLGEIQVLKGEENIAKETFELAINQAKKNTHFLPSLGAKFLKSKNYEFSLKAYLLAKKHSNKASYSIQIANIYSYFGELDKMYEELIELLNYYPNYFQTCKNKFRLTISEDSENQNNKKLKKLLIKNVQKNNSYELSKMIVWLFMQEKKFQTALDYEISIDKRINDNKLDIISLSDVAFSNQHYTTAQNGFQYILKTTNKNSYYYEYSMVQILNIKYEILLNNRIKKIPDLEKLEKEYAVAIENIGIKSETIYLLKNYCEILAFYLDKEQKAIELLQATIDNPMLSPYNQAICKMELAKIFILENKMWEAILLYAQVEKEFNEEVIGQNAKFEKTKINFYNGDFEWAQNQLKVLKLSTSKLIANNAMKLSLLISDNLNLDTTDTALLLYAQTELLFTQKQFEKCLKKVEELESRFPNHTLLDEAIFKKAEIFIEMDDFNNALDCLNTICKDYQYDILYDDALFYQAQIYEDVIGDNIKAKQAYENILLNTPNSIFINQARKRYHILRDNNFIELQ